MTDFKTISEVNMKTIQIKDIKKLQRSIDSTTLVISKFKNEFENTDVHITIRCNDIINSLSNFRTFLIDKKMRLTVTQNNNID